MSKVEKFVNLSLNFHSIPLTLDINDANCIIYTRSCLIPALFMTIPPEVKKPNSHHYFKIIIILCECIIEASGWLTSSRSEWKKMSWWLILSLFSLPLRLRSLFSSTFILYDSCGNNKWWELPSLFFFFHVYH